MYAPPRHVSGSPWYRKGEGLTGSHDTDDSDADQSRAHAQGGEDRGQGEDTETDVRLEHDDGGTDPPDLSG